MTVGTVTVSAFFRTIMQMSLKLLLHLIQSFHINVVFSSIMDLEDIVLVLKLYIKQE